MANFLANLKRFALILKYETKSTSVLRFFAALSFAKSDDSSISRNVLGAGVIVGLLFAGSGLSAQNTQGEASKTPYGKRIHFYRFLEDYSDITQADREADWFASIKKVPITPSGAYVTFGGEYRYRFESFDNANFGLGPAPDFDVHLNRLMLHADVHFNPNLRAFAQFSAFGQNGRPGRPRLVDESEIDIQQAFLDFGEKGAFLRLGRQELSLGSGLYTGVREGPNQRRAFDAALLSFNLSSGPNLKTFYGREVQPKRDSFEDSSKNGPKYWGVYASGIGGPWSGSEMDLYYLGFDRSRSNFNSGAGREKRHTVGARFYGRNGPFSYDYEGAYQLGTFGALDIEAWGVFTKHTYAASQLPYAPVFALIANASSGDSDATDGTLGTFDAMFPNNSSISESAPLRRRNLIEVHPSVTFGIGKKTKLSLGANVLWKQQKSDAIYAPNTFTLAAGGVSDSRYIGTLFDVALTWKLNPHVTVKGRYVHGVAGDAVKDAGGKDYDFIVLQSTFKF